MDKVRTEWLQVQFRFVIAVSESVGTSIRFHYTRDVKIILPHFHRLPTIGLFLEYSRPHCVSQTTNKQDGVVVNS
jgi:hypothetical protein